RLARLPDSAHDCSHLACERHPCDGGRFSTLQVVLIYFSELASAQRGVESDIFEDLLQANMSIAVQMQSSRNLFSHDASIFDSMLSRHPPNDGQARVCPELPDRVEPSWSTDDRNQFSCTQLADVRNGLKQLKLRELRCL